MLEGVKNEFKDVISATTPVILLLLGLQIFVMHSDWETIFHFLFSAALVVSGFTLFLIGVKLGMLPVGESIGSELSKRGSLAFIIGISFLLTFLVTVAEPDVRILANLFDNVSNGGIDDSLLILAIATGVGFFIVISVLRILMGTSLKIILGICYAFVILLSFFTPTEFLAIAFDSGGVTTGPMTVPVILSLGVGITSVLSDRQSVSDSFGLVGLASIGPIIAVMLLGVFL